MARGVIPRDFFPRRCLFEGALAFCVVFLYHKLFRTQGNSPPPPFLVEFIFWIGQIKSGNYTTTKFNFFLLISVQNSVPMKHEKRFLERPAVGMVATKIA